MLKQNARIVAAIALSLLACACSHSHKTPDPAKIAGESPRDVASSIALLKAGLDPDKRLLFGQAVTTLTLVVQDKNDSRTIGYMSPHFAKMVHGRNVDQIIALADLYRASVPADRP